MAEKLSNKQIAVTRQKFDPTTAPINKQKSNSLHATSTPQGKFHETPENTISANQYYASTSK